MTPPNRAHSSFETHERFFHHATIERYADIICYRRRIPRLTALSIDDGNASGDGGEPDSRAASIDPAAINCELIYQEVIMAE
ncbi:hypothetical protein ZHAS_00007978 [Anopheles sinensis]|uniref:Uncharacterized protein n=1 Tax=Anopheles sinensis TaxID=74873 RepID=A0A084VR96_ANOSI|nr:hypothetical protein ZHAS_00007978 [Anopheles sinensis]